MTIVLLLLLAALPLAGLAWLFAVSPGRPAPLRDAAGNVIPGSISERVTVEIGGIPQGMIIQSVDPANPVLLFLHGGPGMVEFFMEQEYPTGLETHFTMVWWEQRGAGMSFSPDIPPETMTMEQMISDTVEVADYLRTRFGQDRIVLLGHSWGAYLGIQVAAAAPDRFSAYVGMAQIAHQLRSEVMAHDYMIAAYRARGDDAMVRRLEAAPVSMEAGTSPEWMRLRDTAMHRIGVGTCPRHRLRRHGHLPPDVAGARLHRHGEDQHLARQALVAAILLGRPDPGRSERTPHRVRASGLFPRRPARPNSQSGPLARLLRRDRCAGEGLLPVRELRPQPALRGARAGNRDPSTRRSVGNECAGRRRSPNARGAMDRGPIWAVFTPWTPAGRDAKEQVRPRRP
jgi:pimeloyl-ACP methyl ester carboxylesterase